MRRALLLTLVLAAVVLAAGPAAAAKPKTLHVVVTGQDHHPLVGKQWHYEVHVTGAGGKPVACRIHLQFLVAGGVVGQVGVHNVKNGFWQETIGKGSSLPFPAAARGVGLLLQATVTAPGYKTAKAGWPVVVK
jgi:hypothetical protein